MIPAAYALLDLKALEHNVKIVRAYAPNAKLMAVIKANAYGHGLLRVAETLQPLVDAVAVARSDEGARLRKAGFDKPITVLEGFVCEDELRTLFAFQLDAVIHAPEQIRLLRECRAEGCISAWLKMDTGMNRLGFKGDFFRQAYQQLLEVKCIKHPLGLMTHLACADDVENDKTREQLGLFNESVKGLEGERSIANSAGILHWPESLAQWVRPGIMLYGGSPFIDGCGADFNLKPVMSLHSRLLAVKQLLAGETVGYGNSWVCDKPTLLGVVAIGYGDGYPRHAKAGTPVLVNGRQVPLIGRVSMDMITVDLQGQTDAKPGDPVTLWGRDLPVETIAKAADTIPYTLLCGITQRVRIIEQSRHLGDV